MIKAEKNGEIEIVRLEYDEYILLEVLYTILRNMYRMLEANFKELSRGILEELLHNAVKEISEEERAKV